MTLKKKNYGFNIVEVMLAISLTSILAIGTLSYQYFDVKHGRQTDAQLMATRIGQLLLEDWKSTGGDADYDPESLNLGFSPPDVHEYGSYRITLGTTTFYISLNNEDIQTDATAGVTLRSIAVTVKWRSDLGKGVIRNYDPALTFTTYVRRDED